MVLAVLGLWTRGCLGKRSDNIGQFCYNLAATGKCTDPQTSVSTYTSTDGILTPVTVYSIELEVTCKTGQVSYFGIQNAFVILHKLGEVCSLKVNLLGSTYGIQAQVCECAT